MKYQNKTKEKLIVEFEELKKKYSSLEEQYRRAISEKKENETRFVKEHNWLEYIIEVTKTGIDIIDKDYNLHFVDNGWQKVYGDFHGRKCYDYFMGIDEPCENCTIPEALKTKNIIISEEFLKKENRFVEVHTIPFQNEEGEWLVAEFNIDITQRKDNEKELIVAKEKAEKSNLLKTAFLQNMSHEIRTPLNAIVGFSEMISSPKITDEKRMYYSDIIVKSSFQLLSIINDVLTISSLEIGQEELNKENVCINSLISVVETVFKQQPGGKMIKLKAIKPLPNAEAEILTDKTKLTQVLTNLISNAIKFTPVGEIECGYTLKNKELEFFVKDNGIGIDKSQHEIIFERFMQANDSKLVDYGGTGLGLSICKGFVELLGGRIWVESELGEGAKFYFTIPYKPSIIKSDDDIFLANQLEIKQIENKTVLVAEDDIYSYMLLEKLLKKLNYKVIHARNGKEAIDVCRNDNSISVVLMDIRMPVIDGHKATMLIKEFRPNLIIIAQTAYATNLEIEKYGKAFDDYLTKPITFEKITNILTKHLTIDK